MRLPNVPSISQHLKVKSHFDWVFAIGSYSKRIEYLLLGQVPKLYSSMALRINPGSLRVVATGAPASNVEGPHCLR